ncbi:hypothetical protein D6D54_09095, partial [Spiroplasma poulsonii]
RAVKAKYKNNKVSYSLDKFHLTSIFKKIYPFQNKNKENREAYHKAVDYFFNGKYEELLQCLEDSKFFISDFKLDFLNKAIRLIKNNKEGIENQTLEYNIGCHVEGDVSHYIKAIKGRGAKIYCKETFINMLIGSMLRLNNQINDEKVDKNNKEKIEFNIFNLNQFQNQFLSL